MLTKWLTEDKKFDMQAYQNTYKMENIEITSSYDGHVIPAVYIYDPGKNTKSSNTVIMVHGLLGNRLSNLPMANLFLKLGYNVITYDQRSSGKNTAPYTTFGYLESKDVVDYVQYALEQMESTHKLGLWGQSMGAATVANAMDDELVMKNVDFVVLDSPLGNMEDAIAGRDFFSKIKIVCASIVNQIKQGYSFRDQRVYPQIENTQIPVLVACSKSDQSIPYEAEESIYNAIKSDKKQLYTVEDSAHSDLYFDHPEEYEKAVEQFLNEYVE